jgi:hypothetical protein
MICENESDKRVLRSLNNDAKKHTKVWQSAKTKMTAADVYQAVDFAAFTAFLFKETLGGGASMLKDWSSGAENFR